MWMFVQRHLMCEAPCCVEEQCEGHRFSAVSCQRSLIGLTKLLSGGSEHISSGQAGKKSENVYLFFC